MAKFEIVFKKSAEKELRALPKDYQQRVWDILMFLEDDPAKIQSRKMQGLEQLYRIRIGIYRLLYHIDRKRRIITIFRIDHRSHVYRNL
ncbi:MAG: type II toxin-antitoxin system RelE/ParE family toxin [Deltaproteobacteria bacterium]|nr:type II toxin-antitoxin system RelE/ParE family toxin [Deltaproteobacteria bacterium]